MTRRNESEIPFGFVPLGVFAGWLSLPVAWLKREADARRIPFFTVGRRRVFDILSVRRSLLERALDGDGRTFAEASTRKDKGDE